MLLGSSGPPALLISLAQPGGRVALVPLGLALVGVGVVAANVIRGTFRMRYSPPHLLARTIAVGPFGRLRDLPTQPMATWSSGSTATARNTTVT